MAYCVKCGVELERDLAFCPLCNTPVYYPDNTEEEFHKHYPDRTERMRRRHVNLVPSKAFVYLMTFVLIIPIVVCLMIDIRSEGSISWSFYPAASLLLIWILMAYPALMRRYSFMKVVTIDIYSVIFFLISLDIYSGRYLNWSVFPVASLLLVWLYFLLAFLFGKRNKFFMFTMTYLCTGLYLYLIEQATRGLWFFELAFPILSLLYLVLLMVLFLSGLSFFKGIAFPGLLSLALSMFCVGTEWIINRFVYDQFLLFWSLIVTGVCIPVAVFLFFVQSNEEFRVYLQKKFHI